MSEFSKLNGYDVKDKTARELIDGLSSQVDELSSQIADLSPSLSIGEDVLVRFGDSDTIAPISQKKQISSGELYRLYYFAYGYGSFTNMAVATTISVPDVGNVVGLEYEFTDPGGSTMRKYIYNSGGMLWLYDIDHDSNSFVMITLEKGVL